MPVDLLADLTGRFDETIASIEDRPRLQATVTQSRARAIISLAAHSAGNNGLMKSGEAQSDRAMTINVNGFRNVLEAAVAAGGLPVIWTSSTVVYGESARYPDQPVDETAPTEPNTFYGLTKELCERLAAYYRRRAALPVTGLRLPLVLGANLWYQGAAAQIENLIAAARERRSFEVVSHDELMDLMHVADVARAVLAVLESPTHPQILYNINGFRASMSQIVSEATAQAGNAELSFTPAPAMQTFPAISDALIRADLGFIPRFDLSATIASLLTEYNDSV